MKIFKKTIEKRMLIQSIKAVVIGLLVIITFIIKIRLYGSFESLSTVDKYILIGLFFGGEFSAISAILKYRKALKIPEILDELHIKETDERNRIITLNACQSTLNITCTLLGFSGLIASFFNLTVLLTISVILILLLVVYFILLSYYSHKF